MNNLKRINFIPQIVLGLIVLVTYLMLNTFDVAESIATLAIGGIYSSDMQWHRDLLSKKLVKVNWNVPIWSKFMGMINTVNQEETHKFGTKVFKATGQPIEVLKDFTQGGAKMDTPVAYPLTEQGISGAKQLLGNEEQKKLANMEVKINQKRHGVLIQDNKLSKQALQQPKIIKQLMSGATADLGDWFQRWNGYNIGLTFLQGASEHICNPTADGGLGHQRVSHMNTYVAGSGRVTFSNTHATYEAAVAAALGGLTNVAGDYMTTNFIRSLVYQASHVHRIQPPIKGSKLYPIAISDAALLQLSQESTFIDAMNLAKARGDQNPQFTGKWAIPYMGALLLIDETLPSAYLNGDSEFVASYSTTGTTAGVQYGLPTTFMSVPVDGGNLKPAILFGKSAIACGVSSDLNFENEEWDYKQKKTEGADMIIGHQIADIIDTEGYWSTPGNKRYENVSSLTGWTYSPSEASF